MSVKIKYFLTLIALQVCAVFTLTAQVENVAMQFAALPTDAVNVGNGGIDAIGKMSDDTMDISVGYMLYASSEMPVSYMTLNAGYRITSKLDLSLSALYGICDEYEMLNSSGIPIGNFKPGQILVTAGAGYRIVDFLQAEVELKYINETLSPDAKFGAFATDVRVNANVPISSEYVLGASVGVSNLGTEVKSVSGKSFSLPTALNLVVGCTGVLSEEHNISAIVGTDVYFCKAFAAAIGASYTYNDFLSVRAGYRHGGKTVVPSFVSLGVGVNFFGISLDAAYLLAAKDSPASGTVCVSLGYSF